jgi:hypothetical protein
MASGKGRGADRGHSRSTEWPGGNILPLEGEQVRWSSHSRLLADLSRRLDGILTEVEILHRVRRRQDAAKL